MVISLPFFWDYTLAAAQTEKRSIGSRHVVGKLTYSTVCAFWVTDWSLSHTGHLTGPSRDESIRCSSALMLRELWVTWHLSRKYLTSKAALVWSKLALDTGSIAVRSWVRKALVSIVSKSRAGNLLENARKCGSESLHLYRYAFITDFLKIKKTLYVAKLQPCYEGLTEIPGAYLFFSFTIVYCYSFQDKI